VCAATESARGRAARARYALVSTLAANETARAKLAALEHPRGRIAEPINENHTPPMRRVMLTIRLEVEVAT
jgi:hypothetical protein